MSEGKKEALDSKLEALAHRLLGELATEKRIEAASFKEVATTFGICVDKMQLLRGKATEISGREYADLSDDELDRRMEEMQRRAAAARAREALPQG